MFKAVKNKKLFEVILDQIKDLLVTDNLKVGQKIPSEIELSQSLGVSRSSLREALKILSVLGMLESKTGEGTIIRKAEPENLKSLMSLVAVSRGLDTVELFEIRMILEMHSASLAANRRNQEDLNTIKKYLTQMDSEHVNQETEAASDYSFHIAIVETSKNSILVMLMELISGLLGEQIKETRKKLSSSSKFMEKIQNQHWKIYEAIKEENPEKSHEAMLEHLTYAQQELGIGSNEK
jgi:GntR family transcriptional repressor for pyruvate dehydrogenase complex